MTHPTPDAVRHLIAFRGDRAATGPATWGQRHIWRDIVAMLPDTAFFNVAQVTFVPPGVGLPGVLEQLAELVARHESLRTLAVPGTDGALGQRVLAEGSFEADVLELTGAEHGAELRVHFTEAARRLESRGFDNTADVPFRALVGVLDGAPQAVVLCLSHFAADLTGVRLLIAELDALLAALAAGTAPPPRYPAREPLEQAEFENSPAGLRMEEKALRHWSTQLDRAPADNFPRPPGDPEEPRFWRGELVSRAVPEALRAAAARHRSTVPNVLLAATATLLARGEGLDACGLRLVTANRFRPELHHSVGNLAQEVFVAVDVSGDSFADALRSVWSATLGAHRNGQFRPERARALTEEAGVAVDCLVNDLWSTTRDDDDRPVLGAAALAEAARESEFRWADRLEQDEVAFFLETFDVFGDPGLIRVTLLGDTSRMPPARIEGFLRGLERVLLALATGEVAPADFPAVAGIGVPGPSGPDRLGVPGPSPR
ncbi:condensation domain-containing protein [Streptomyces sp. NPDC052077]|uniref:condensation domain-containing protein n=1 Tax=Streptomyces sp. NPDC052077 TaxID=3154757 RepID=UPI0034212DA4